MTDTKTQEATALVPIEVKGTAIEKYGRREIIRELVYRLMQFHPAAKEVGQPGMIAAAQLSVLIGASPLPGLNEIHIWKDPKKGIVVQPGINYDRRRAKEMGGVYWVDDPRPMTVEERGQYMVPDGDPAAICRGARFDELKELMALGITFVDAMPGITRAGIATVSGPSRYAKKNRPLIWTAIKCAEADLLRKLFPNLERPKDPLVVARDALDKMEISTTAQVIGDAEETNAVLFGDDGGSASLDPWDDEVFDASAEETKEAEPAINPEIEDMTVMEFYDMVCAELPYFKATKHVSNTLMKKTGGHWFDNYTKTQLFEMLRAHAEAKHD